MMKAYEAGVAYGTVDFGKRLLRHTEVIDESQTHRMLY